MSRVARWAAVGDQAEPQSCAGLCKVERTSSISSAGGSGLLGAALSCDCNLQLDPGGAEHWTFRAPPLVQAIGPGGAAERAGLRAGDLIERIDGLATTSPEGGRRFGAIKAGERVRLGVLRGNSHVEVVLVAGKR